MDKPTNIVLWGPTGSGKTWLVQAFCRKVNQLDKVAQKAGLFQLELVDLRTYRPVDVSQGPTPDPTEGWIFDKYLFTRRGLGHDLSSQVSSHAHVITLVDEKGDVTTGKSEEVNPNDPEVKRQVNVAKSMLSISDYVIIVLDQGTHGPDEYLGHLQKLRPMLKGKPRYIAACLTKADAYGIYSEDVPDITPLIKAKFTAKDGEQIIAELEKLRDEDEHQVMLCAVSAAGYIMDNGKAIPNMGLPPDSDKLSDKDKWTPVRVQIPFFWLFNLIEIERLGRQFSKDAGLFYRLFPAIHARVRQELRTTYNDMLKQIEREDMMSTPTLLGSAVLQNRITAQP